MFKEGSDDILKRCIPYEKVESVLHYYHSFEYGGHFWSTRTSKVLQYCLYWPTIFKYAFLYVKMCDRYQKMGNISKRDEMSLNNIIEVELFDVWGIDSMWPFPPSFSNQYILVVVDYISKWVEWWKGCFQNFWRKIFLLDWYEKVVLKFLMKNIFTRLRTPKIIIIDKVSHFLYQNF